MKERSRIESGDYDGREDTSGHVGVHGGGMGRIVLSGGNASARLPELLRDKVRHGGSGLNVLPNASGCDGAGMVQKDAGRFFVRAEGAAGHYARKSAGGLRRRPETFSERGERAERKARPGAAAIRVFQQERLQIASGVSGAAEAVSENTAEGFSICAGDSQQVLAGCAICGSAAREPRGAGID